MSAGDIAHRGDIAARTDAELDADLEALQGRMAPMRAELEALSAQAEVVRGEVRRRERLALVESRRATRTELGSGAMPSIPELVAADTPGDAVTFDDLVYLRESATEVRLGYASAAHQQVSFTDGARNVDATDLGTARGLWRDGWDFGTIAARGVRIYPVGSRAERVVPAAEVHVRLPPAGS